MTDRAENLPKLSRLGRFEILSELGKGAMGVVYLAKDPSIGRLVAIKTIRASGGDEDDSESREFRERFMREAQTAGILSHPNIVTIYDVGEDTDSGVSFIAMEYIEGKTIKTLVGEVGQFPSDQIADIIGQVAEALDYAHRKGIIHRDIKPANIMITTDGKVKITDFGIAKVASSNLTTTGQFLGTPNYMSPEQVTGASVDGRSDIFSLGVVLYEMLSRRKPFAGENLTTISYKIVHENFAPVADPAKKVPAEFDAILAKALSKDPWNRYQRGKDFALALYQAKARFEEQAIFQDLGTMVSSAENLPGLKLESMDDATRQDFGTAPGAEESTPARTVAVPIPPSADASGGASRADASTPSPAAVASGEDRPGSGEIAMMAGETVPSAKAVAPRAAHGSTNVWKAAVNPKYWWGIVAAAILTTAAVLVILKMRIPKVQEQQLAEAANRAQVELQKEVQHGKDLYQKGQYNESLAVFRGILQRDPSVKAAREYSQMAEEALRNEQAKKADDEKAVARANEIADHLQKGRAALGDKNFEAALSESEAVLNLDAKNEEATKLSEDTRKALAEEKKAGLKKADKKPERDKKKKAETLAKAGQPQPAKPAASAASSATSSSKVAVTANTPATVHVSFNSPISKGYLMIAVNDSIIYRKNFDFGKANGGVVSDSLHAAPGNSTIKVWLTTPDSSIKGYQALSATLSGGDSKTLTLTLQGTKFSVRLS